MIPLVIACNQAYAQNESNRIIKRYSIQEGLSNGIVNSIAQDKKGLMWFATEDGFNRFNGYAFQTFKFDVEGQHQFHDNFVQSIFSDSDGKLWISSRRGLYQFDLSTQQLTSFLSDTSANANDVSFISEGSDDNLWVAWYWNGFGAFQKHSQTFKPYDQTDLPRLTSTASIVIFEDSYRYLWVGSQDKGLNVFQLDDDGIPVRVEALSHTGHLPSLYVKCVTEDHLGNLWIGTTKGLVVYLRKDNRFHSFSDSESISTAAIFSVIQDSGKNLWIGTQGNGLIKASLKEFDGKRVDKLQFFTINALDQYNISHHTIRAIFEDKDRNIWLGTHGDGAFMISSEEKKFLTVQSKRITGNSESYVSYMGLCNDHEGYIWAGTDGDGIYKIDETGKVIRHYQADGTSKSTFDNSVVTAFKDFDDNLWFGTYKNGILRYDRKSDSFRQFQHANSSAPLRNQVRAIFQDSKKRIWVGASRGGLCVVDQHSNTFRHHSENDDLQNIDVRAIVEDKSGGLWIGCYGNGLFYYDPAKREHKVIFEGTGPSNPLKSNVIYALVLDNKNRLWIGTAGGGLSVYHINEKIHKRYSENDGLINNTIYGLAMDDGGDVWISTIKGISKFSPESEKFFNYTHYDGLQSGQFNPNSSLNNLQEGYICFGGTLGLNVFSPAKVTSEMKPPRVMISGFQLFNRPVKIGSAEENEFHLQKVVDETKEIILRPDQSVFSIEFTGLNFSSPEKNRYAYKLEGIDRDWTDCGTERSVTYRYLQPGRYTFKVKATNHENAWPKEFASLHLTILPPFWRTPAAYALYAVVLMVITYFVYVVRKRQEFLRRRLIIEKSQRKRERQMIQEKLSFFTEVSHEFRTPLTLMIGPLEEIISREGTVTPVGKKLKLVYKNAFKLLNLINKLLDYRKVENGSLMLRVREENMVAFMEEIYITFRELALRKKIDFKFHPEVPTLVTWFDREKMEMVFNNILSNSFKYIGKGNAICITVKMHRCESDTPFVVVEIRDNGIGIKKQDLKYIFDWFYQGHSKHPLSSGIGLALAKKLVYLHKGQIFVNSTEGVGSTFTIKIPMGKDHFSEQEVVFDETPQGIMQHTLPEILDDIAAENHHRKGLKSLLVVEDDDEVRRFVADFFERDFKIYEASNGKEGMRLAIDHNPDVVISDVMMPEMNGVDLCKELKQNIKTSHIPVILLTARTSFTHHREGLEIGADHYLTKPFSPEMLSLTINNILQSRENLKRFYRNTLISDTTERKPATSPDELLLQRIHQVLMANLDNPSFNLDHVCDEIGMSRSLLYKKVKVLTGLSPVEYVRTIKLSEAAKLLKTQRYKVFEVVYMVGFTDLKYFRECFSKQFGYPPSQLLEKSEV